MAYSKLLSRPSAAAMAQVVLTGYANMFSVGGVYALSVLQAELPRLLHLSQCASYIPFGAASLGLSLGVVTAASLNTRFGAYGASASGTALWGMSLCGVGCGISSRALYATLAYLVVGGVGVGWTYLAVIVMVSEGLPYQPLARSAIGPLGFSSGTAACVALASALRFDSLSAEELGATFVRGGIIATAVGAMTGVRRPESRVSKQPSHSIRSATSFPRRGPFFALLYLNALPGMMVFSSLLPEASQTLLGVPHRGLPYYMVFLTLGGILAPTLRLHLGTKATFIFLFVLRAVAFAVYVWLRDGTLGPTLLAAVLFAHGAGFSIIPGLIKEQLDHEADFPAAYGQVLVAWGLAGMTAVVLNVLATHP